MPKEIQVISTHVTFRVHHCIFSTLYTVTQNGTLISIMHWKMVTISAVSFLPPKVACVCAEPTENNYSVSHNKAKFLKETDVRLKTVLRNKAFRREISL